MTDEKQLLSLADQLKTTAAEWRTRYQALEQIEKVVTDGAASDPEWGQRMGNALMALAQPLSAQIVDLRSEIVRQCAHTIGVLAETLGNAFNKSAAKLIPTLITVSASVNRVIRDYTNNCLQVVIAHCDSKTILTTLLTEVKSSKSKMVKTSSMELLTIILQHWPIQKYARLTPTLEEWFTLGFKSPSTETRDAASKAFWLYAGHFPDRKDKLLNTLDARTRKIVERAEKGGSGGGGAGADSSDAEFGGLSTDGGDSADNEDSVDLDSYGMGAGAGVGAGAGAGGYGLGGGGAGAAGSRPGSSAGVRPVSDSMRDRPPSAASSRPASDDPTARAPSRQGQQQQPAMVSPVMAAAAGMAMPPATSAAALYAAGSAASAGTVGVARLPVSALPSPKSQSGVTTGFSQQAPAASAAPAQSPKASQQQQAAAAAASQQQQQQQTVTSGPALVEFQKTIRVGSRVSVEGHRATVQYMGTIEKRQGEWVGLQMDAKVGDNNGTIDGVCYFVSPAKRGLFTRRALLKPETDAAAPVSVAPALVIPQQGQGQGQGQQSGGSSAASTPGTAQQAYGPSAIASSVSPGVYAAAGAAASSVFNGSGSGTGSGAAAAGTGAAVGLAAKKRAAMAAAEDVSDSDSPPQSPARPGPGQGMAAKRAAGGGVGASSRGAAGAGHDRKLSTSSTSSVSSTSGGGGQRTSPARPASALGSRAGASVSAAAAGSASPAGVGSGRSLGARSGSSASSAGGGQVSAMAPYARPASAAAVVHPVSGGSLNGSGGGGGGGARKNLRMQEQSPSGSPSQTPPDSPRSALLASASSASQMTPQQAPRQAFADKAGGGSGASSSSPFVEKEARSLLVRDHRYHVSQSALHLQKLNSLLNTHQQNPNYVDEMVGLLQDQIAKTQKLTNQFIEYRKRAGEQGQTVPAAAAGAPPAISSNGTGGGTGGVGGYGSYPAGSYAGQQQQQQQLPQSAAAPAAASASGSLGGLAAPAPLARMPSVGDVDSDTFLHTFSNFGR